MNTQRLDDACGTPLIASPLLERAYRSYYAEVPAQSLAEQSRLIDQLIDLAFDTFGARHLDVRVLGAEQTARS